ncbi:MAG: FAS1-like dehydratase domain-containing protein [Acidimicrobiales bacterium]
MAVEKFAVEASHIMMFARAVGDPNRVYTDEDYAAGTEAGGIIAPPTFAQASAQFDPDYRLRPKIGEEWMGSGKEATGIKPKESSSKGDDAPVGMGARGLHAEQHFEYHRQMKPGDILSTTVKPGENWEKQSKRAGTLKFSETVTEYRDQTGELVITARSIGVTTEKAVEN